MAKTVNKLNQNQLGTLPPGMHNDGNGLYLSVTKKGSRSWIYRYRPYGKTSCRDMGLGPISRVTLAKARSLAHQYAQQFQAGTDPIDTRKALKRKQLDAKESTRMTLERCVTTYLAAKKSKWTKEQKGLWERPFRSHAYPNYGKKHIAEIDDQAVRQMLEAIWDTKTNTAKKLRQRLEELIAWAQYMKYVPKGTNPASWKDHLSHHFGDGKQAENRAALPYHRLPQVYAALKAKDMTTAECLRFIILTGTRLDDALEAKWNQIDWQTKVWTIPGRSTSKMKKDFPVPLSDEVLALLKEQNQDSTYIFPGQKTGAPLSDQAVRNMNDAINKDGTIHGMRSTLRSWLDDCTEADHDMKEMILQHKIDNQTEAAYRRTTMLEKRRGFMQAWATYLTQG